MTDRFPLNFKLNKVFFTLQFVISMTLILCAVVVIKQTQYIKNKPLGFDRDILELQLPKGERQSKMKVLKQQLAGQSAFSSTPISVSSGNPVAGNQVIRYELGNNEFYTPFFLEGDTNLIKTLGLNMKTGPIHPLSGKQGKIVNQKFVEYFDIKDPIGARIPGTSDHEIIGVVADFNVSSLKKEIPLYIIGYTDKASRLLLNYSGLEFDEILPRIRASWEQVFPNNPFTYTLIGDELLNKHQADFFFSKIIIAFALVSIVISCFGLFSLAQNNCQRKGKEIAIRKSLGASIGNIISLLLYDFGKWILISFFIASFVGYFLIQNWLENFTYRTDISWWVFAGTAIIAGFFSLLAIGYQTIEASLNNPVTRLRNE